MAPNPPFKSFEFKTLHLKNGIVMAPIMRSFSPGAVPGSDVVGYYDRKAVGDVGLILSEGTVVTRPASSNDPEIPYIHGEASLRG